MFLINESQDVTYDVRFLLQSINEKRDEMLITANKYGLQSDKTIKCSQDLDQLILKYQKLRFNKLR